MPPAGPCPIWQAAARCARASKCTQRAHKAPVPEESHVSDIACCYLVSPYPLGPAALLHSRPSSQGPAIGKVVTGYVAWTALPRAAGAPSLAVSYSVEHVSRHLMDTVYIGVHVGCILTVICQKCAQMRAQYSPQAAEGRDTASTRAGSSGREAGEARSGRRRGGKPRDGREGA